MRMSKPSMLGSKPSIIETNIRPDVNMLDKKVVTAANRAFVVFVACLALLMIASDLMLVIWRNSTFNEDQEITLPLKCPADHGGSHGLFCTTPLSDVQYINPLYQFIGSIS